VFIDNQSIKAPAAEKHRYDAANKIVERQRHIAVDTDGAVLMANLTTADISDSVLEPDPKAVERYQYVVIQAVFAKRWSASWHGLVSPGGSTAGKGCVIQAI